MTARLLGPIVRLQVQRDRVKWPGERYDPEPILAVEEAAIGAGGMLGRVSGGWLVDVHHRDHPRSSAGGRRALSVGFTGHYELMAARYGEVPLGVAGENMIVSAPGRWTEDDLGGTLVVRAGAGEVPLRRARVAAPCAEFTSFLLGLPGVAGRRELADDVAFLHDGMRGFILAVDHLTASHRVRVGDEVWVLP